MDAESRIIDNLKTFEINCEIKPNTMKHLIKIDSVLESLSKSQNDAIQELKNGKISINKISKETGISRQTFYNNPIIITYIENYISLKTVNNPYDIIEKLREEIRYKDKMIKSFVERDANISKYKAKNQELIEEVISLQETIKSQEELIHKLKFKSKNLERV